MKKEIYLLMFISLLLFSCKYNATYENDEIEKKEAEAVTEKLYKDLKGKDYLDAEKYFSSKFFQATSKEDLVGIFTKTNEKLGDFKSKNLIDWKTHKIVGSNPSSEYLLLYEIEYQKYPARETIRLIKEKDSIRIIGYNVNSEGFLK